MTEQHRITPPPELVSEWVGEYLKSGELGTSPVFIATRAAQWGADQELEACLHWASEWCSAHKVHRLLTARRPNSPSLKQQALEALDHILNNSSTELGASTIRRALEQLDD